MGEEMHTLKNHASLSLAATAGILLGLGCAGEPAIRCASDIDCVKSATSSICAAKTLTCEEAPARATLIGRGDGTAASVTLATAFETTGTRRFTGFGFNPVRPGEMWVVDQSDNSVFIVTDPGTPTVASVKKRDPAAGHFMAKPTGMSFAADGSWGTCGETDNSQNGGTDFMGPAVFSSDPAIFAKQTAGGLGSHLDMLHDSPFCMGIVHETANRYWVVDGGHGAVARYDFNAFHVPGADDHADGEIRRYGNNVLARVEGVPSHLALDAATNLLYIADTGNKRVAILDTTKGTPGTELDTLEPTVPVQMDGVTFSDLVPPGTLQAPSGITFAGQIVYVSDNATGRISAYTPSGQLVRYLDTGLAALGALVVGPDGKLYLSDLSAARIYRLDP